MVPKKCGGMREGKRVGGGERVWGKGIGGGVRAGIRYSGQCIRLGMLTRPLTPFWVKA